jgi:leucyl-tRNA synthetase
MTRALVERAKEFRREPTRSEAMLWDALRRRTLGVKFRRQVVIGPFVADFVCHPRKLVVEIDGRVHETQLERDAERQAFIEAHGFSFFRVTADDVERDVEGVIARLRAHLATIPIPIDE